MSEPMKMAMRALHEQFPQADAEELAAIYVEDTIVDEAEADLAWHVAVQVAKAVVTG